MLELNNLQAFVAVARNSSFSVAAERLHLTQPAVSRRIAALESELGLRLFDRIGRLTSLTEAGRMLLPKAEALLDQSNDIRRSLANLAQQVSGPLSIGTSHHIGLHRLPPVLRNYHREHPQVQLDIRFLDSESGCAEVEHGSLDLAIVTLPNAPRPNLELTRVWTDPLHIAVAKDHPLAGHGQLPLDQLLDHPAVLPARGTYTRQILEQALGPEAARVQARLATNYLETLRMLVSIGLGWSLLPATLLGKDLDVVRIEGLALSRDLGLVRHRGRTLSNAAQALMRACLENIGSGKQRSTE